MFDICELQDWTSLCGCTRVLIRSLIAFHFDKTPWNTSLIDQSEHSITRHMTVLTNQNTSHTGSCVVGGVFESQSCMGN